METELRKVETTRYEGLPRVLKGGLLVLWAVGIATVAFNVFHLSVLGLVMVDVGYYYFIIALFNSSALLILPARKNQGRVPWYDFVAAALTVGIGLYFFLSSLPMVTVGWIPPTSLNAALGLIFCLSILEGGRRFAGNIYLAICLLVALYPLVAAYMPGALYGRGFPASWVIGFHAFSTSGVIGLPARVMGDLLIGFLIFAGILLASGAGEFFLNLASSIFGRFRGGPAKIAVVSSGLFGSLSGSVFSNVVATGSVTIPAMKRTGYAPHYAAAIEACASTGGAFMPPVMGAIAFIMAVLIGVEYAVIIAAAALPAILYYFGLLMQVDAHAGKIGLKGFPPEEVPSLKATLKEGWPFIFVFVFLLWGLLYMRWEAMAAFYASGLMLLLSFSSRKTMMTPKRIVKTLSSVGILITQSMAVIIPIGFIICGLTITGATSALVAQLISLGEENIFAVLLIGAVACYVMGMAGLIAPAYIFLAVSLAPAVIEITGANLIAVHLFIVYYAVLADITPPVAVAAFIGASIAGASPMRTGLQAMRLGIVVYFIPFFFVLNPALILQGPILESAYLFALCLVGITFIAGGLEGYLVKIGRLGLLERPLFVIGGFLIAFPGWNPTIIGALLVLFTIAMRYIRRKMTVGKLS